MTSPTTAALLVDRLLDQRIVVLGEPVEDDNANRIVSQLLVLSADDPESDICLYINSPGGSVMAGLAIYDTMQLIPNDVATVAVGFAASMGQILLCAGAPGKRYAFPSAQVVMHEGSAGTRRRGRRRRDPGGEPAGHARPHAAESSPATPDTRSTR